MVDETFDYTCDFCLRTRESNKFGKWEELLSCKDCTAKAHPSCMKYSPELAKAALSTEWQCIDCKTCCVCEKADNASAILFCDACDKAYHMTCHEPTIKYKPSGIWKCKKCLSLISSSSKQSFDEFNLSDPKDWTPTDVGNFFASAGMENYANVFVNSDIDGTALLLLKRDDCINGLGLKLGPAVKLYRKVKELQEARDEVIAGNI